jgi:hypothetical protein
MLEVQCTYFVLYSLASQNAREETFFRRAACSSAKAPW